MLVTVGWVFLFVPETKGRALESYSGTGSDPLKVLPVGEIWGIAGTSKAGETRRWKAGWCCECFLICINVIGQFSSTSGQVKHVGTYLVGG